VKTVILPGFSPHNKDWALTVQKNFKDANLETIVHFWKHWETAKNSDFSPTLEIQRLSQKIGNNEFNILAKSIGTAVAMYLIEAHPKRVQKVILCGIPLKFEGMKPQYLEKYRKVLSSLEPKNVQVYQNDKDPWADPNKVSDLIQSVNKNIPIFIKPRSDHEYPYFEDFIKFLED
jgi:pimeloyl-ACP methyl ester carboxylesterase